MSSERVLILAETERDAASVAELFARAGVDHNICSGHLDLMREMQSGVGAMVLTREALSVEVVSHIAEILDEQPSWSFLPIILLIGPQDLIENATETIQLLKPLRNTTLLERPVRVSTLLSVLQSALADRRRQFEVRDLLTAVEKNRQEAVKAGQAKSTFLANMSHEIRTPLGVILGFSELLQDPNLNERDKQSYLASIKRNGQLLSTLIDDILDLAKVEAGKVEIEAINVSIDELIAEVVAGLEPRASAKGIPLKVTWDRNVPRFVMIDPIRYKQVFINVLSNAVKFTQSGEIQIHLFVSEGTANPLLHLQVTDTGVGIAPEQARKLFRPFTQADNSITRKFGGTGLGLVLARKLAQAQGGDLQLIRSALGQGSTFEITVEFANGPARTGDEQVRQEIAAKEVNNERPLLTYRVLLVDDSKENQILIGRMLTISGAQVETASDGVEAMEKALIGHYDLILMDMQMPKLGGNEATSRLREKGYSRPIVALTAHALPEDRVKCLNAGCDDYLTKPVQWKALVDMVVGHIEAHPQETTVD